MATDEWKQENPKVSGHIPKELKAQLNQFIKDQGLRGTSEALRIILESHFNKAELSTSSQPLIESSQPVANSENKQLNRIEEKLDKIYREIQGQPKTPKVVNSKPNSSELVDNSQSKSSQPVIKRSQLNIFDGWLTTGEAYGELQNRGYEKSLGTFRRTLRDSGVTEELEDLGLIADFDVRNQANPKDNSVRWLKIQ